MMADGHGGDRPGRQPAQKGAGLESRQQSHQMASDWITIWQSELSALATDREAQEAWVSWVTSWAEASQAMLALWSSGHDTRADAPAGPAPAMAASDDRDDAIGRLAERVAELERRLAGHEGGA